MRIGRGGRGRQADLPQAGTDPEATQQGSSGSSRGGRGSLVAGALAVVLSVIALVGGTGYVVEGPGPAVNTLGSYKDTRLLNISGHTTYPSDSRLDLTTVSVGGGPGIELSGVETLMAWADPHQDLLPRDFVYPSGTTKEESDAENQAEMTNSQQEAAAAALGELGIDYTTDTVVAGFVSKQNADVLKTGDVITHVDGKRTATMAQVPAAVKASTGSTVQLGITRSGKATTVTADVKKLSGNRSLGIYIAPRYAFPFQVKFGIKDIGGPSAGTMLALGIIDELTPGSLAGKNHVAGTGTISADGTVGAIGGIPQKVVGARKAGATIFLAPAQNCAELSGRVPDGLTVYSMSTLKQARSILTTVAKGGDTSSLKRCG